jgi:hypothetical protein
MKELTLQKKFLSILNNPNTPWGKLKYAEEFNYSGGRVDVIAIDKLKTLYAFEIKLEKWKIALNQAYRNTSFANKSYIVLPKSIATKAIKHEYQFKRRSVGLCYLEGEKIVELLDCSQNKPIMGWLNNRARNLIVK